MKSISFTTTATCRPEILRKTYQSFSEHLKDLDFSDATLYINIDPLPDPKLRETTLEIARGHFGRVIHRFPEKPNFTSAVNWLWTTAETDYIFHLEDDWKMNSPLSINDILDQFKDPQVMEVALRAYPYPYKVLCLSPSVWSKSLYKKFAGKLDESMNPEVQLREDFVKSSMVRCIGKGAIISDIGRDWLAKQGLTRGKVKNQFTTWE